jgi:4a-hydroxytetrahydrobiopterin dehydratase
MEWQETDKGLYRKFKFDDFMTAFAFMSRVAELAEAAQHHPDWRNSWNTVEIWLLSHDADDSITEKDHSLARQIDGVVQ